MKKKCAIIGTGNIAHHFVPAIKKMSFLDISTILSRDYSKAKEFAKPYDADVVKDIENIDADTDIVFLMISDDQINKVSSELSKVLAKKTLMVHFSGTKSLDVLPNYFSNKAVIWPIQSISKEDKNLNLSETPMAILASNDKSLVIIEKIGRIISDKTLIVTEEEKEKIHLSAVFANNFSNHMYLIADEILKATGQSLDLLLPIIEHTTRKLQSLSPSRAQTGPAVRNDTLTIQKHMDLLKNDPDTQNIYSLLTQHIIKKCIKNENSRLHR